ncbi:MAG: nicotinate-nucleotide adenylyltransferase [Tannerellaceae bacterium]|jgi:nicotinate-nucleotide adenylyltransferase|nr:nicotinate-nucleotide adenylyltransferase [Tannerellaceae bacterium]
MSEPRRVAVFPGSFNPIHIGHLALANWLAQFGDVDEVRFVVSPLNPLKHRDDLFDERRRLDWVRDAIDAYPKFSVSDVEFHLPRPSYTLRTFDALTQAEPATQFRLLIGADNWATFDRWKDYYRFLTRFPVLIFPRPGFPLNLDAPRFATPPNASLHTLNPPLLDISSSFIRQAITQGLHLPFFLPESIRSSVHQAFASSN